MGQDSSVNERKGVQVLLDTSALLLFYEGINVFEELEKALETNLCFMTIDAVINELKKLSKSYYGRKRLAARMVLDKVINKLEIKSTRHTNIHADKAIVMYALEHPSIIIVTLDKKLGKELKRRGIRVLTWWSGRHRFSSIP